MRINASIDTRMTFLRFLGKVLKEIKGKLALGLMIERVRCAKLVNEVIVATTLE